jgi:threonine/homoserine/homoserine lactone efflux protein
MRTSGAGGIASFLGIACPTCNKVLVLIFGGPALLAWFDPVRPWLAAAGVIVMGYAAFRTWRAFGESRSGLDAAEGIETPRTGGHP